MKIQRFGNWLARRWLNLSCLLLIMVLLGSLGIQITNRSPIPSGLTTIGIGSSKIITIGSEAEAAGSVDYTYGAANANVQFQAALNALPATGGRLVIVSTGNVSFPALVAVTRAINNVTIEGSGRGTYFVGDGVTPPIIAGGNNWVFNNIRTNVTGAVLLTAMGATTGWMWTNVATSDVYYSYRSPTGQARFNDTTVASLTDSGLTSGRIPIAGVGGLLGDDGDLTFSGTTTMMTAATATTANITTLNADVGRAYTYIVAGADAPSNVRTQATYLADGVADDVQIQAALDAAYALGGKQKIGLFGTLTASTSVTPKSNVDVDLFGEVDLNFNTNAEGILFNGTVNSTWDGGIWRRQGTMIGATRTIYVTGASDRTLVFKNMKVYNDTTETSAMEGVEGFRIHGTWNGNSASPTLINVEAWGSQNSLSAQAAGIDISGYGNTPLLINVIGHAGQGDLSAGLMFQNATRAIIYNGIGYGTTTVSAATVTSGIQVWDTASPELNDCTGYGGAGTLLSYGLWVSTGAATPTINGGNFYGGTDGSSYNIGVRIDGSTSPKLNGVTGKPQEYSNWWSYDDANNGRWRPFASKRYQLISIYVYSWAAIPGVTLDLGTSVGGSEIAQNITLATGSEHYFNFTKVYLAADAYMYATPSGAVADDAFFVGYVVAHDEGYQMGLYLDTKGAATINSSSFFAGRHGMAVWINNPTAIKKWSISNSLFKNYNTDIADFYTALAVGGASPLIEAPIYNTQITGEMDSTVWSFAPSSQTNVLSEARTTAANLQAIYGDTRGMWSLYETTGTTLSDFSWKNHSLTSLIAMQSLDGQNMRKGQMPFPILNGTDEGYEAADNADYTFNGTADQSFSLVVVVEPTATDAMTMIAKRDGGTAEYMLRTIAGNKLEFQLYDSALAENLGRRTTAALSKNTTYVIVATYDGSGTEAGEKIYINGVRVDDTSNSSGAYDHMRDNAVKVTVGFQYSAAVYSSGWVGRLGMPAVVAKELSGVDVWDVTQRLKAMMGI